MIEPSISADLDLSDEDDKVAENNEIDGIVPKQFEPDCNFYEELKKENCGQLKQSETQNSLAVS